MIFYKISQGYINHKIHDKSIEIEFYILLRLDLALNANNLSIT